MYAQCQNRRMFELEKDGKAVIFAPSENLPMSTYAMNAQANRELYNLGMKDYYDVREQFKDFMKNEENGAVSGL